LEHKLAEQTLYDNIRLTKRKNRHAYFDVFQEESHPRNIKAILLGVDHTVLVVMHMPLLKKYRQVPVGN
jgi:hypothetical protein